MAHNERCSLCKNALSRVFDQVYGCAAEREHKFMIPSTLEAHKGTSYYNDLKTIYNKLVKHRGHDNFVRAKIMPKCDLFYPKKKVLVEFDEYQHFSIPRMIALENYPDTLKLGFSREKWIKLCEMINAKDPDPIYRDEQRAWYDTLRDFLPLTNPSEVRKVVRVSMREFHRTKGCLKDISCDDEITVAEIMKNIKTKKVLI